jgi:hypothetical protein
MTAHARIQSYREVNAAQCTLHPATVEELVEAYIAAAEANDNDGREWVHVLATGDAIADLCRRVLALELTVALGGS